MDSLNLKGMKKIAVMGGTFDPIHYGHLVAAEAVRDEIEADCVIFIPTGNPPHKQGLSVTAAQLRYDMTALAVEDNPHFVVSDTETNREGMSYTLDTVKALKEICDDDCEVYFITGADAVSELITWHDPKELLSLCSFIAVTRPGYKNKLLARDIELLKRELGADIRQLEVPALAISSTDIRNRVFAGNSINYLLPPAVCVYIEEKGLYKNEVDIDCPRSIKRRLRYMLTPKRFLHSRGVAEEAYRLAVHYGLNFQKAYMAGILHDCAKCLDEDTSFELCEKYGIKLDRVLREQPELIHSFLGAEMARHDFDIEDEEILSAIRYHTTGRPNMSELEKIIYLADFFEPSRKPFEGIETIRSLAYTDLNRAMDFALNHTINYIGKKNRLVHPLSLEAADCYRKLKEDNLTDDK